MFAQSLFRSILMASLALSIASIIVSSTQAQGQPFQLLAEFKGATTGNSPSGRLIQGRDGYLYGTTRTGGTGGAGTIFKMDTSGVITALYSFMGQPSDGSYPAGGVIQAQDGNFYGATVQGGLANQGTVFKMDPAGTVTVLHSFLVVDGSGSVPGELVEATDGKLYGVSPQDNTVFSVDSAGSVGTVYRFNPATDGALSGPLIQGGDGNLYGSTSAVGVSGGVIFKMSLSGTVTVLGALNSVEYGGSHGGLVQGSDGALYGTAEGVPANSMSGGAIFKFDTASNLTTTLHSFNGSEAYSARNPLAGLIQARDGTFYGTTAMNIAGQLSGSVFKMSSAGAVITLHTFDGRGRGPEGTLVEASDGNIYGTTNAGDRQGSQCCGTVFRLLPNSTLAAVSGTAQSARPGALFPVSLRVRFVDQTGHPIAGMAVNFSRPNDGPSATLSTPGLTDANGETSVMATANDTEGSYEIVANIDGLATPAIFQLINIGDPASIATIAGTPQSVEIQKNFPAALQVLVTDGAGGPVPGVVVTFSAPSSGPSATLSAPAATDANGQTSVTATANGELGSYAVTATIAGVAVPATFSLTNEAASVGGMSFYTATPCRVLDTRQTGGALLSGVARSLAIVGACGIPPTARAVSFNLTATGPTAAGSVAFYPDAGAAPVPGTINFSAGQTRANNQVLALATVGDGDLQVRADIPGGGSVHVIVDVNGYFQ